ncbi:DNA polymerase III subunit gamma/tau [Aureimonas flava]|uniref:DNA polymerase III subunit gamma/tau n=1 Tax=Aureimonas flava TaxID=2320271 RepID=A0A3A1WJA7_9HYPH|nr:DNA polymerase III subunit gamma/tau [Aureimonas flava]RIY01093.1 DNA polymerase III subunit gamma/tau [Aureimonas flava]
MAEDPHPPTAATPYRVLARKYRPRSFDDLIGQEPMVRTLTNAFEAGRIAQAWMLTGVRGVGKTTTARILARALNYETETVHQPTIHMIEPGLHDQAIMEGRHVDVVEMDAASHTGIDDIREIIAQVRYRPVSARYKVYIIDEVHMLSTQAFNGLLKTLEEPPEHVKFVFATTEIRKVPITVLSRCQRFDLRRVDPAVMIAHLRRVLDAESVEADDDALRLLARASEGSVRDALSLTDQAIAHGAGHVEAGTVRDMLGLADRARIVTLFELLMRGDGAGALREFAGQYEVGADPLVVLTDLADFTHLVTSLRFVPETAGDASLSPVEVERGRDFAERLSVRTLSEVWQMLLKAIEETRAASAPRQAAEMALIRIAYATTLPSPEDLARLLREGGARPASSSPGPSNGAAAPRGDGAPAAVAPSVSAAVAAPPPTAPQMRAGGPTLAARMVASAPQPVSPAAAPAVVADPDSLPASLRDLERLAGERRDSRMKAWIRRYLRLVRMEPGRLEIELADGAPVALSGELTKRLFEWTGMRWVVTVAGKGGGETLEEADAARRARLIAEAEADPEVAAILAALPGAKVREVRLRGEPEPAEPADDGPPLADESDLPERIDIDPSDLGFDGGDDDMGEGVLFEADADPEDD